MQGRTLKEAVQSNLKRPEGNIHNHVPISSTVNKDNAEGHRVSGWEERTDRGRTETSGIFCLIVNSFYTDKKHLLRSEHTHTHTSLATVGFVLRGKNYTKHEDNKQWRLAKVNKQSPSGANSGCVMGFVRTAVGEDKEAHSSALSAETGVPLPRANKRYSHVVLADHTWPHFDPAANWATRDVVGLSHGSHSYYRRHFILTPAVRRRSRLKDVHQTCAYESRSFHNPSWKIPKGSQFWFNSDSPPQRKSAFSSSYKIVPTNVGSDTKKWGTGVRQLKSWHF